MRISGMCARGHRTKKEDRYYPVNMFPPIRLATRFGLQVHVGYWSPCLPRRNVHLLQPAPASFLVYQRFWRCTCITFTSILCPSFKKFQRHCTPVRPSKASRGTANVLHLRCITRCCVCTPTKPANFSFFCSC